MRRISGTCGDGRRRVRRYILARGLVPFILSQFVVVSGLFTSLVAFFLKEPELQKATLILLFHNRAAIRSTRVDHNVRHGYGEDTAPAEVTCSVFSACIH